MTYPWDNDDSTAPPAYQRAWRDLDLSRRPHLCAGDAPPSYISALAPKARGIPPTERPAVDISPPDLARGRKSSAAKRAAKRPE